MTAKEPVVERWVVDLGLWDRVLKILDLKQSKTKQKNNLEIEQ